jgi:arabinogalactan oligomer/maltooligosaccharide transport system permease protein
VLRAPRSFPYLLLMPAFLVMVAVVFYPLIYNFYLSFRNMSLYRYADNQFVGLQQFQQVLSDPVFYEVLVKTFLWTGMNLIFHVFFGVLLALLLSGPVKGRTLFRTLLILPWAMPQFIAALTWRGMFNYEYGAINLVLQQIFHLPAQPWLSDPILAFLAPVIVNIWLGFPFIMVVALAGLAAIPYELYEAADLDGANWWHKFRSVTWPSLLPVLSPAILLGTIWTFNNVVVMWLVSQGGQPADRTHILVTYIYKVAFTYYRYSYGAAFSVVVFLILLVLVFFLIRRLRAAEATA